MITKEELKSVKNKALAYFEKAHIALTDKEKGNLEITDPGPVQMETMGLQIIRYIDTCRYCAKEIVLLRNQTRPEHKHLDHERQRGKEETFRGRYGKVYLCVEGQEKKRHVNPRDNEHFVVFDGIVLTPDEHHAITPNTLHWFRPHEEGATVSEFRWHSAYPPGVFIDRRGKRIRETEEEMSVLKCLAL